MIYLAQGVVGWLPPHCPGWKAPGASEPFKLIALPAAAKLHHQLGHKKSHVVRKELKMFPPGYKIDCGGTNA